MCSSVRSEDSCRREDSCEHLRLMLEVQFKPCLHSTCCTLELLQGAAACLTNATQQQWV
jgi:hypothetical protein